uniref:Uromodulin-like isoform X2 n=1 Tax=Pogona vitticeps TaxID=103695 RepID=A0ABM5EUT4_9SAUR
MTVTSWPLILALFLPAFESFSGQQMELKDEKEEAFLRPRRNPSGRCLPNPCFHQGACQVVDDNPSCVCKPGFTGPFCKELMVKLECEEEYMKMMVRKEAFELLKIPLALVHLKNRSCKASEAYEEGEGYWGAKLTSLNHTACGSDIKVNGSHVSYFNMIESDREIRGVITRSILLRVHFSCVYAYKGVVGLIHPLQTADTLVQFAVKEGDFTVTMMLYKSASYDEAYQQQPLVLLMTDILYVLLRLQGQAQVSPRPHTDFPERHRNQHHRQVQLPDVPVPELHRAFSTLPSPPLLARFPRALRQAMSQPAEDQEGGSGCLQEDRLLWAHSVPLSITSGNAGCQGTGLRLEVASVDPQRRGLGRPGGLLRLDRCCKSHEEMSDL